MFAVPTFLFPPISYCVFLQQTHPQKDEFSFYHKQSPRNHFEILNANGRQKITFGVQSNHGQKTPLNEVFLDDGDWSRTAFRSLQSAYGKSAFFFFYQEELKQALLSFPNQRLVDVHLTIHNWLMKYHMVPDWTPLDGDAKIIHIEKKWEIDSPIVPYHQVFQDRFSFENDLSILDLMFNLGPEAKTYLRQHPKVMPVLVDHRNSSA
jgi:hypothetical protein